MRSKRKKRGKEKEETGFLSLLGFVLTEEREGREEREEREGGGSGEGGGDGERRAAVL